jgi:hypothetical protein
MGIEYRRPEMTLTALARDTARMGLLLAQECATGTQIEGPPEMTPLPATARPPATRLAVEYGGLPAAAPGDSVAVNLHVEGQIPEDTHLTVQGPAGWQAVPDAAPVDAVRRTVTVALHAPMDGDTWPMRHLFTAQLETDPPLEYAFGVTGAGLWKLLGVHYDPLPDGRDPVQKQRRMNHHFVDLKHPYLPEPDLDVEALYQSWSRKLGRPAIVASYEHEIDLSGLVGLRGPYCAYLARTVISPQARPAYAVVGNSDGYRLYLNGELVAEVDECVWWTPFNNVHPVQLRRGPNQLLLKLLKRRDKIRFTLGFRARTGKRGGHNHEDWLVDLADAIAKR